MLHNLSARAASLFSFCQRTHQDRISHFYGRPLRSLLRHLTARDRCPRRFHVGGFTGVTRRSPRLRVDATTRMPRLPARRNVFLVDGPARWAWLLLQLRFALALAVAFAAAAAAAA